MVSEAHSGRLRITHEVAQLLLPLLLLLLSYPLYGTSCVITERLCSTPLQTLLISPDGGGSAHVGSHNSAVGSHNSISAQKRKISLLIVVTLILKLILNHFNPKLHFHMYDGSASSSALRAHSQLMKCSPRSFCCSPALHDISGTVLTLPAPTAVRNSLNH